MGAFLARHGKQLAFIPLLLLVGVLALRLVDTVQGGSGDGDTTAVDEAASSAVPETERATTPRDRASGAEQGEGQAGGGSGGSLGLDSSGRAGGPFAGGSSDGGGRTVVPEGGAIVFTPDFSAAPSTSGGSSGGTAGSGGSGGGDTSGGGGSGGDTSGDGSGDGSGGSGDGSGGGGDTTPDGDGGDGTSSPTPPPEQETDPDYNDDGRVSPDEANRYCQEEEGLEPFEPGYLKCVSDASNS